MLEYDVIVIGGGPAGMAAALAVSESGCSVLLAERSGKLGGILNQCVHSGFGLTYFGEELTGIEFSVRLTERVNALPINVMLNSTVITLSADRSIQISSRNGLLEVKAKAVVLATGCRERPIGALDIAGTRPSGIFTAGAAQKMVNVGGYDIGSRFVILGSGDVGMIMARQLMLLGKEVIMVIEQNETCGGLERNRINCLEKHNIPLNTRHTVSMIHGNGRISGITVRNLADGSERHIGCDTLITSVGLIPERELADSVSVDGLLPEWLFLCGNACFVHNLVDDVVFEALYLGSIAARHVKGENIFFETATAQAVVKSELFCIACPKSCSLVETSSGYSGALCGRTNPMPNIKSVNA